MYIYTPSLSLAKTRAEYDAWKRAVASLPPSDVTFVSFIGVLRRIDNGRHEHANRTRKDTRDCRGIFHDFHDPLPLPSRRPFPDIYLSYTFYAEHNPPRFFVALRVWGGNSFAR